MITIAKYSKAKELNSSIFRLASVSAELEVGKNNEVPVAILANLIPSAELLHKLQGGDIKKDKFIKKYKEQLKTDAAMIELFNLGLGIENGIQGMCLFCSDDEWDLGYMKVLQERIEKIFGVTFAKASKVEKDLEKAFKDIPKKVKKDEKKYKKAVKTIIKDYRKDYLTFSPEGDDNFNELRRKYALDYLLSSAANAGMIEYKGDEMLVNEKVAKQEMKTSSFVSAFIAVSESDKGYKKVIQKVFKNHDLKLNEKAIKKLSKTEILYLTAECVAGFQVGRYGLEDKE